MPAATEVPQSARRVLKHCGAPVHALRCLINHGATPHQHGHSARYQRTHLMRSVHAQKQRSRAIDDFEWERARLARAHVQMHTQNGGARGDLV
jgi:hypothetical protein